MALKFAAKLDHGQRLSGGIAILRKPACYDAYPLCALLIGRFYYIIIFKCQEHPMPGFFLS